MRSNVFKCVNASTGHVDGCGTDNEDGSMESIDLSDDENPDESCVVVDSRTVYAFTSRARRFRSCKVLSLSLPKPQDND